MKQKTFEERLLFQLQEQSPHLSREVSTERTDIENPTTGENIQIPVGNPNFVQRNIPIVPANSIIRY